MDFCPTSFVTPEPELACSVAQPARKHLERKLPNNLFSTKLTDGTVLNNLPIMLLGVGLSSSTACE